MWRFIFAIPLIAHGLAHISGFIAAWTAVDAGYAIDRPWILYGDVTYKSSVGRAFGLLWLVAAFGLLGAGFGILLRGDWWIALGLASAVISLIATLPWWNTVPPGAKIGAAFDVIILVVLFTPLKDEILRLIGP